jgi:hypothetical protein
MGIDFSSFDILVSELLVLAIFFKLHTHFLDLVLQLRSQLRRQGRETMIAPLAIPDLKRD